MTRDRFDWPVGRCHDEPGGAVAELMRQRDLLKEMVEKADAVVAAAHIALGWNGRGEEKIMLRVALAEYNDVVPPMCACGERCWRVGGEVGCGRAVDAKTEQLRNLSVEECPECDGGRMVRYCSIHGLHGSAPR